MYLTTESKRKENVDLASGIIIQVCMRRGLKIKYSTIINTIVAIVLVCYVGPFASYKGSLVLIGFLGIMLFLTSGVRDMYNRKRLLIWNLLAVYLVINSMLNIPNSLKYLLVFFVGYALINRNMHIEDCKQVLRICKFISIIEAFVIMLQHFLPTIYYSFAQKWFFYSNQYEQVTYLGQYCKQLPGLFYEVSFAALVLSMGIIMNAVELFEMTTVKKKIFSCIYIAVAYYAVILTRKRSFILIIPVVIVLLYLIRIRQKLTFKHLVILFFGILAGCFMFSRIYDVVIAILSKGVGTTADLSSREEFWGLALNMFRERPLFGMGLNSFDMWFNAAGIRPIYYDFAGAHNSYIQILGETGIIGMLLYISAIFSSLFKGIKMLFHSDQNEIYLYDAVGIMIVMLIYALSGNVLYQPQELITLFLVISIIENYYFLDSIMEGTQI